MKRNTMLLTPLKVELPDYHSIGISGRTLPTSAQPWPIANSLSRRMRKAVGVQPWQWPDEPVFFVADPHADAEAFKSSLIASGGVTQSLSGEIQLTDEGRKGRFVIGGDCLDKGPSNLQLLRAIRHLMTIGADVKLLAGNHDVRLLMGLRGMSLQRDMRTEHLFLRMGPKVIPLIKEVFNAYRKRVDSQPVPAAEECRRLLYPSKSWFKGFPKIAKSDIPKIAVDKEMTRMRQKLKDFEASCEVEGLSIRDVYGTALVCHQLFLQPGGEFAWFFNEMQLIHREGSFVFLHAGLDDSMTTLLANNSIEQLNQLYRHQINSDLYTFYYGTLANTMRTKYRDVDRPLTRDGVERAYEMGIHAVVHGHRNQTSGQRISLRRGMIHIEGDITLNRNSRQKEGLSGHGIGVTIIRPEGRVIGISNDYPFAKVFEPQRFLKTA
ncbi:metallophosphoesterase [Ketobacter sp. MCCC 1A13808]|uniref:metallophosphoesterase n=1 Tax=Ketobacter sp. MCCC 1A13808 TaxID=2602738 RepID=UPI0012EB0FF6|nr:metallophosphoesterase [Ketobacter sp. MCCC 1A13808]MVF12049.1 metallophosphoesterase [Ketobacter sp. MCCC 1A13808]